MNDWVVCHKAICPMLKAWYKTAQEMCDADEKITGPVRVIRAAFKYLVLRDKNKELDDMVDALDGCRLEIDEKY
jgi:hypothetical protein